MIKRFSALFLLVCCLAMAPAFASEGASGPGARPSGLLVTYQGNKIEVLQFKNLLPSYLFRYQGVIQSLPIDQIKSLTIKSGGVLLERRDGITLKVTGNLLISTTAALEFVFKDPLTGKEAEGSLDPILINVVLFN